ncbi:MAG: DMT family transporter [Bacillota bacterium]
MLLQALEVLVVKDKRLAASAVLTAVAASWGLGFVATAKVLEWLSPVIFLGLRFLLGFGIMLAAFCRQVVGATQEEVKAGAITGSVLAAGFIMQTYCMKYCSVSTSAFLTALYVVLVPILSSLVLGKTVELLHVLAAVLSFGGVAVASLGNIRGSVLATLWQELWPGEVLGMGCALGFALHILAVGRWAPGIDVARFATIQVGAASAICLALGLLIDPWPTRVEPVGVASLVYLGAVNTAAAFFAQNWAQRHTTATQAAVVMSSEPIWAAVFAFALLGQSLRPNEALGDLMILAGMVLAQDATGDLLRRRRNHTLNLK